MSTEDQNGNKGNARQPSDGDARFRSIVARVDGGVSKVVWFAGGVVVSGLVSAVIVMLAGSHGGRATTVAAFLNALALFTTAASLVFAVSQSTQERQEAQRDRKTARKQYRRAQDRWAMERADLEAQQARNVIFDVLPNPDADSDGMLRNLVVTNHSDSLITGLAPDAFLWPGGRRDLTTLKEAVVLPPHASVSLPLHFFLDASGPRAISEQEWMEIDQKRWRLQIVFLDARGKIWTRCGTDQPEPDSEFYLKQIARANHYSWPPPE